MWRRMRVVKIIRKNHDFSCSKMNLMRIYLVKNINFELYSCFKKNFYLSIMFLKKKVSCLASVTTLFILKQRVTFQWVKDKMNHRGASNLKRCKAFHPTLPSLQHDIFHNKIVFSDIWFSYRLGFNKIFYIDAVLCFVCWCVIIHSQTCLPPISFIFSNSFLIDFFARTVSYTVTKAGF